MAADHTTTAGVLLGPLFIRGHGHHDGYWCTAYNIMQGVGAEPLDNRTPQCQPPIFKCVAHYFLAICALFHADLPFSLSHFLAPTISVSNFILPYPTIRLSVHLLSKHQFSDSTPIFCNSHL